MRMRELSLLLAISAMAMQCKSAPQEVDEFNPSVLPAKTTWIANDGYSEKTHIPHDMLGLAVAADGTVATVCGWDEGGANVAVFRDGKLVSIPEGSGTGGWGRFSLGFVAIDERYVYHLQSQHGCDGGNNELNQNGRLQFPPCDERMEWKTIRRYDRETGLGAPFADGYGYRGDMMIVCHERARQLTGLALCGNELYVGVRALDGQRDSVKVYDKQTMKYVRRFAVPSGIGAMTADDEEHLWVMYDKELRCLSQRDGKQLKAFFLPSGVEPGQQTYDARTRRLLIPNAGRDLNILFYDNLDAEPRLAGTFGQKGGVFAVDELHKMGQVGVGRFCGPHGAGVDARGRLYVASTFVGGGRGAVVEAYDEQTGSQLWKREGLVFTATADFHSVKADIVYTPEKLHRIIQPDGRRDELLAFTLNPFLFPEDQRTVGEKRPFVTSVMARQILGQDYFFISDMYGGLLCGYRFEKEKYGYVGVPFLDIWHNDTIHIWNDRNGDGQPDASERRTQKEINPYNMSHFVDHDGGLWRGVRQQGFMYSPLRVVKDGVPQYDDFQLYDLPQGINDVKRIWYDTEEDELFLYGFSEERPDSGDTWWCAGSTMAIYRGAMKHMRAGEWGSGIQPDVLFHHPFSPENGTGRDHRDAKSFCVCGDYIFMALARYGTIYVYRRKDGRLIGRIEPGEEVERQSGWSDFNYNINARHNGHNYEILVEENAFAKVLYYELRL